MPSMPWFPIYYKDFSLSRKVVKMTHAQKGAYVELLGQEWDDPDCSLPNRLDELKDLIQWKGTDEEFKLIRKCFTTHPVRSGRLVNTRLYFEWQKAEAKREAAKASALTRWQKSQEKPQKHIQSPTKPPDRTLKGLTPLSSDIAAIADKYFPPVS